MARAYPRNGYRDANLRAASSIERAIGSGGRADRHGRTGRVAVAELGRSPVAALLVSVVRCRRRRCFAQPTTHSSALRRRARSIGALCKYEATHTASMHLISGTGPREKTMNPPIA